MWLYNTWLYLWLHKDVIVIITEDGYMWLPRYYYGPLLWQSINDYFITTLMLC